MTRITDKLMWLVVVLVAILLQGSFTFVDSKSTPSATVIEFSRAYFLFEDRMQNYLCNDFSSSVVSNYLLRVSEESAELGLETHAIRRYLAHIKTQTVNRDSRSAQVRITALTKNYINPLFAWIADIFHLGRIHSIDETFDLVKEGDEWKICSFPFDLCSDVVSSM